MRFKLYMFYLVTDNFSIPLQNIPYNRLPCLPIHYHHSGKSALVFCSDSVHVHSSFGVVSVIASLVYYANIFSNSAVTGIPNTSANACALLYPLSTR